jgi:hypothetical protein
MLYYVICFLCSSDITVICWLSDSRSADIVGPLSVWWPIVLDFRHEIDQTGPL